MNLEKYYVRVSGKTDPEEWASVSSKSPLPLEAIPNMMGINLCNVDRIEYTKRSDGQLTDLTIYFIPDDRPWKG
jgi:hypothetical protein